MTHTSRPWDREYIWNLLRIGKKSLNIVTNDGLNSPDEDDADLIAAAPDLYAALDRLYGRLLMSDRDGESHITAEEGEMAEFALKKARGERP